jgi:hypothetical protein
MLIISCLMQSCLREIMFPYEKGFLDLIMYTLFVSLIDIILKEVNWN